MTEAMQSNRLSVMRMVGRTWLTITMVSGLLFSSLSGVLWYQGSLIASNQAEIVKQNAALSTLNAKTWRDAPGRQQRTFPCAAEGNESRNGLDGGQREAERSEAGEGVRADDRAGNTVAERIRAATAGLLAKGWTNGRAPSRMAEDVWSYATENAALSERVTNLSQQVDRLSGQLSRLSR
ncbi:MbeD/MobD like [Klebsiella pneumoniae]|uniref:MbeD/MobD like n=1 Tax=Klebsiella pneumoniae TaxID=573 RepID=A0A509AGK5_KLEPN|nr:MbeD/MobD like [Klebsiella pneumoniae]